MADNMERLEAVVARLPEAERVDIAEWGDHPTFRVRGRNFVFADQSGCNFSLKLTKEEAAAVVATDPAVRPGGYGLGRHGWVSVTLEESPGDERWEQVEEWIRTSYTLVAPRKLAKLVVDADSQAADSQAADSREPGSQAPDGGL